MRCSWAWGMGHGALEEYLTFLRTAIGANKHYMGRAGECIHLVA